MQSFPKPKKMDLIPPVTPRTTQTEWEKHIQSAFTRYRKFMRKSESQKKGGGLGAFDFTDAMVKRRQRAILNLIPEIYKRYKAPDANQPAIGEAWIELNLPFVTHSFMDVQSHTLFAASIWILDQLTRQENWRETYRLLPTDDRILDELCRHDAWDCEYEYELIYSVEYILHHRNPIELDGNGYPRTVTSEWLAKGKTESSEDRQKYDALIARIPQEAIEKAVAQFREYFWQWVDRFYANLAPFLEAMTQCDNELRESRVRYNKLVDEFGAAADKLEKLHRQKPKTQPAIPFAKPAKLNPLEMQRSPLSALTGTGSLPKSDVEKAADEALALSRRLDEAGMRSDDLVERANELYKNARTYTMHITRQGRIMDSNIEDFGEIPVPPMEPMQIPDPYAMCFALLYLAERNDDLPWLYGACCGFMAEVVEALPWGIFEYDEQEDDIWEEDEEIEADLPKSVTIPDAYERKYRMKGDAFDFPRSLAQIIYEETGCVLPRNLHLYDRRARLLGKYGIRGKDAANALMLMSTLGTTRRMTKALNLDGDLDWLDDPAETEEAEGSTDQRAERPVDAAELKDEIKKLKAALHASEKESRETKKTLAGIKATAERERRELADLRAYVFNSKQTEEEELPPEEPDRWPYEVQKNTLVFGGHETWTKGIKSLLTGNVRFIDKDYTFDTGIIRRTDLIWIQPNAMSHTMYYRIIDTARLYSKPVRYFSYASWARCAEQVSEEDRA